MGPVMTTKGRLIKCQLFLKIDSKCIIWSSSILLASLGGGYGSDFDTMRYCSVILEQWFPARGP